MGIIWVAEEPFSPLNIAPSLMGDFPVRCIASLNSLALIMGIHEDRNPDLIVINLACSGDDLEKADKLIEKKMPSTRRVYLNRHGKSSLLDTRARASVSNKLNHGSLQREGASKLSKNHLVISSEISDFDVNRVLYRLIIENREDGQGDLHEKITPSNILRYKDIEFDYHNNSFRIVPGGMIENLPLKEARLMKMFLENPGQCLNRNQIRAVVWGDVIIAARSIDSHISRLRKKMTYGEVSIESIYGGGYLLK